MEKLNELVKLAGKVLSPENAFEGVDAKFEWKAKANPTAILTIAEAFRGLKQRAETAEMALDLVRAQRDLEIDRRGKYDADKAELYAEVYRLREEIKGPEGFDSWKDAAVYLKASKTNRAAKRIDYLTAMAAHHSNEWHKMGPITGYMKGWNDCLAETRPAPAADLAALVPDERTAEYYYENYPQMAFSDVTTRTAEWNACRAAILRKIEELNK